MSELELMDDGYDARDFSSFLLDVSLEHFHKKFLLAKLLLSSANR